MLSCVFSASFPAGGIMGLPCQRSGPFAECADSDKSTVVGDAKSLVFLARRFLDPHSTANNLPPKIR